MRAARIIPYLIGPVKFALLLFLTLSEAPLALSQSCSSSLPGQDPPCLRPIRPVLECVQPNLDGSFTASWGYLNENALCCFEQTVYELPIREQGEPEDLWANFFTPAPIDRGQPTIFGPGFNSAVFETTWDGSPLTWTLRYMQARPPFFVDAAVTAVGEGGTAPFCSTDCLGNPNGNAVIDRCGVCDGDGTSCLGCEDFDITNLQFDLDSIAQEQNGVVIEAVYRFRRIVGKNKRQTRFVQRIRKESAKLAAENWLNTWVLPPIITTCTNTEFCVSASTGPLLDPYAQNAIKLRDLALKVTKRISRNAKTRKQKRISRNLTERANELLNRGLESVLMVPAIISSCS